MKTTIRPATHDDLDLLLDIAEAMHAESPRFSRIAFSEDKVLQLWITLVDSPNGLLLVAERDSTIIGGNSAFAFPHWMSGELVASDYGVFVLPEHRGGMTAFRLVNKYVEWAHSKGVKPGWIQLGISTGILQDETAALYRAIGFKQFSIGLEV